LQRKSNPQKNTIQKSLRNSYNCRKINFTEKTIQKSLQNSYIAKEVFFTKEYNPKNPAEQLHYKENKSHRRRQSKNPAKQQHFYDVGGNFLLGLLSWSVQELLQVPILKSTHIQRISVLIFWITLPHSMG
jgi:hypothetical protein